MDEAATLVHVVPFKCEQHELHIKMAMSIIDKAHQLKISHGGVITSGYLKD